MVADNSDNIPHYDAALALDLADGIPAARDYIAHRVLESFADGGELAVLFDVSRYRSDTAQIRVLVHEAIGYAQQGAMPSLQLLCEKLSSALKSGEFALAEELGGNLPATLALVRAAVAAEPPVQSGT